MCLIVFAWQAHPEFRLILAGNRDEYFARPTTSLSWWADKPGILAGRDLRGGGTWLAAGRSGRFATVTNYRETATPRRGLRSRGELVTGFIANSASPEDFARNIDGNAYAGFSLLLTEGDALYYASNRDETSGPLPAGVYALGNASLDLPSHKLTGSKSAFQALLAQDDINVSALFRLLADRTPAPAGDVDAGSLPFEIARAMTATFIVTPEYGTRSTSVLTWSYDNRISLTERRFDNEGSRTGESQFAFAPGSHAP